MRATGDDGGGNSNVVSANENCLWLCAYVRDYFFFFFIFFVPYFRLLFPSFRLIVWLADHRSHWVFVFFDVFVFDFMRFDHSCGSIQFPKFILTHTVECGGESTE